MFFHSQGVNCGGGDAGKPSEMSPGHIKTLIEQYTRKFFPAEKLHFRVKENLIFVICHILHVKCGGGNAREASGMSSDHPRTLLEHILRK